MFQHQTFSQPHYRWGDIPDYDETIFNAYISSDRTAGISKAFLNFDDPRKYFQAKIPFDVEVEFPIRTRSITIERATRCPDQRIVWDRLEFSFRSRGQFKKEASLEFHDGGPSNDGRHYLRTLAYDKNGRLNAWSVDEITIENFDKNLQVYTPNTCSLNR